jgi:hypothetical protein
VADRRTPPALPDRPFRGSEAVLKQTLTRRQLNGPNVRRLFPDVYVGAFAEMDHFTWCEAAALVLPASAAIGGWSALSISCPATCPDSDAPVDVVVPPPARLRAHPRLRVHRAKLDPAEVRRYGDLRVTAPVRTAFDIARRSPLVDAVIGLDALLFAGLVTAQELQRYVATNSFLHGADLARRAVGLARRGAQSPMETRARLVLVMAGLPEPVLQYEVRGGDGRLIARLDMAYERRKLALEYQGDHHRDRAQFRKDLARINRLYLAGWTVLQLTADDVLRQPDRMVAQVRKALGP